MKTPQRPLFLARQSYRRRRAADASRFLPVVGVFLILLPLLRGSGGTAGLLAYLFVIWILLIVLAALLSGRLSRALSLPDTHEEDDPS